ncbi:MAG: efflux RND transporter periplasmic adaptor subunit [Kofleriaceae bacterium]|nr:efflux RND transporter periplasmic adaptor subunit [Kofleriaceae bacterium]
MFVLLLAASACGRDTGAQAKPAASSAPAQVGVFTVEGKPLTLTRELPGRTSPYRIAEVRARVNGIVLKRLFDEGTDVKAGQKLFQIDPAPYQAALESAKAQVVRAEAAIGSSSALVARYQKLLETNAVSKQEYDDAVAKQKSGVADLAAAKAAVKTAQINLDYTTVTSPIAGRIGRSEVTEGAYVQAGTATLLATVQQLDKMYVDLTWSSSEMMKLRRSLESGELKASPTEAKVTVVLEDGREYPIAGTLQFTDASVDQTTGSVSLRATIGNPNQELLPGMFVRARIDEGTKELALLVPQKAVARDQNGNPVALVVDKSNKVERRSLVTDRAVGDSWLVTSGLAAGEQVIIEGIQKVRPGMPVTAVPAGAMAAQAQPQAPGPVPAPAQGSAQAPAQGSAVQPATKTTEK